MVNGPFSKALALITDPRTEPVAIDGIALGDAGVTMLCDVFLESAETLLPRPKPSSTICTGVPCPAGQFLKSAFAIRIECAAPVALRHDPPTEPVAIDGIALGDAGVTMLCDVFLESAETLCPVVAERVPCPADQVFESALPIRIEGSLGVFVALHTNPLTELVAIDRVGLRDAGMTVASDVARKSPETILPVVGEGVPRPAGQLLKSAFASGLKGAFGVVHALIPDPITELEAIDLVGPRDAGVTVVCDVAQELAEALLPLGGVGVPSPAGQPLKSVLAVGSRLPLMCFWRCVSTHVPSR